MDMYLITQLLNFKKEEIGSAWDASSSYSNPECNDLNRYYNGNMFFCYQKLFHIGLKVLDITKYIICSLKEIVRHVKYNCFLIYKVIKKYCVQSPLCQRYLKNYVSSFIISIFSNIQPEKLTFFSIIFTSLIMPYHLTGTQQQYLEN